MTENNKYWRGIEDQSNPELSEKLAQNEFSNEISQADFLGNDELAESSTSRRDFLKFMGFSTAAATLAACEAPIVESIPYVVKPDSLTPGIANYYASSYYDGYDFASVLVKTREGRPIKIEPNNDASYNGATNARVQASVLSLYDGARMHNPMMDGAATSWGEAIAKAQSLLTANSVVLTRTVISPAVKTAISKLGLRHVSVDAVSQSNRADVYEALTGVRALPTVELSKARVVFAVGADFLGDWDGENLNGAYAAARKPGSDMLRHIQAESGLSLSGANADVRIKAKVSEYESVLAHVYNRVANAAGVATVSAPALREDIKLSVEGVANELITAGSGSLVLNGLNSASAEKLAAKTNELLASAAFNTSKLDFTATGSDSDFAALLEDIKSGAVTSVLTLDTNVLHFSTAMASLADKVSLVSIADRLDETASKAIVALPMSHYLEAWSDAAPVSGIYTVGQPTISPLFDSKSAVEIVNTLAGGSESAVDLIKASAASGSASKAWNALLHDGFADVTSVDVVTGTLDMTDVAVSAPLKGLEFYTYTKAGMGAGNNANNPWTYELPDPVTRLSWDNYVVMSAADAVAFGVEVKAQSNGSMNGTTINITVDGATLENVPVWIQPGQTQGSIGLAVGYGRTEAGKVGNNVGVNANELLAPAVNYTEATVVASEAEHGFASVQLAHTMMGRKIVNEINLPTFLSGNAKEWNEKPTFESYKGPLTSFEANLWDDQDHETSHMWNMSIDLNSCTGCGACVVACSLENNVPVVGKDEVRRHRDMHWLRIDRYYSSQDTFEGDLETVENISGLGDSLSTFNKMEDPSANPQVTFQPVMCQHCNHAPCETVCPVAASSHGRQGQNHMAYNRCVGTRYCANNCPYKVRRFNWFLYNKNDEFDYHMNDDLGRMVLNPDVVVRSRGVMEKCSMCIQMTQKTILDAKLEGREIKDGEFQTACSSACGTGALAFGDINDKDSEVAHLKEDNRMYHLLESIGTKPNVMYQVKVRNT